MKYLLIFMLVFFSSNISIAFADTRQCQTMLNDYFSYVGNPGYYPVITVTSNSMWHNGNHFSSYGLLAGSYGTKNTITLTTDFLFTDKYGNNFKGNKQKQTVKINKNGKITIILNSWGNKSYDVKLNNCIKVKNGNILLQASGWGGRGPVIYNFTLTSSYLG